MGLFIIISFSHYLLLLSFLFPYLTRLIYSQGSLSEFEPELGNVFWMLGITTLLEFGGLKRQTRQS